MKEFFIVPVVNELLSDKPNHSWHWNHIPNAGCLSTAFRRMSVYRFHWRRPFGQGSTPTNPKKRCRTLILISQTTVPLRRCNSYQSRVPYYLRSFTTAQEIYLPR